MEYEHSHTQAAGASETRAGAGALPWLDWAVALGGLWLIGGLHLDGWAHHHIRLETFFTPWHGVLYSGYAVSALSVAIAWAIGLRQGRRRDWRRRDWRRGWRDALTPAYRTSLLGAALFLIGGVADMVWHTLFGIELSLAALLSPPHLFLALGAGLLISGPLRSALYRKAEGRPALPLPALLSTIALVGLLAFFSEYVSPWYEMTRPGPTGAPTYWLVNAPEGYLVASILLQSALAMFAVLLLARRFRLPFGALTLLFTIPAAMAAITYFNWGLVLVAGLGGLVADLLVLALRLNTLDRWRADNLSRLRLFAFLVPLVLYGLFFGGLKLSGGLDWSPELWGGAVILAGFVGWLLSYAFFAAED